MSIEKVKRYDHEICSCALGDHVERIYSKDGDCVDYADVAGLVEALRLAQKWTEEYLFQISGYAIVDDVKRDLAVIDNELARWTA